MVDYIHKGVLELTENFKFQGLQTTGPTVQLTAMLPNYDPSYFMSAHDVGSFYPTPIVNKINSFFLYTSYSGPYVTGTAPQYGQNTGYNLTFRTVDNIEVLINVPGMPIYWSRFNDQIWIGSIPDQAYWVYARYQKQHPFPLGTTPPPSPGTTPWAGNDTIYMPDSWKDVLEYQCAMRGAQELNLSTKASELHTRLYGDEKFQRSGGLEGSPGLIFQRTSQENRDQTTSRKTFRLKMGSV